MVIDITKNTLHFGVISGASRAKIVFMSCCSVCQCVFFSIVAMCVDSGKMIHCCSDFLFVLDFFIVDIFFSSFIKKIIYF